MTLGFYDLDRQEYLRRDGSAVGGHVLRGMVRPTLELVVTTTPTHLQGR